MPRSFVCACAVAVAVAVVAALAAVQVETVAILLSVLLPGAPVLAALVLETRRLEAQLQEET